MADQVLLPREGGAHAVEIVGRRTRFQGLSRPTGFAVLSILVLSFGWSLYVFADSQLAYLCATAASVALAIELTSIRSQALVVMLVAEVGLLGTDANGELASGTSLLGSLRLLDVTIAAALLTLGLKALRARDKRASAATPAREQTTGHRNALLKRAPEGSFVALVCYALALWLVHGHRIDQLTRADVRVIGLGFGMWIIARTCTSPARMLAPDGLSLAIASLGPLIAAKAVAIYFSGLWVVGSHDRLQASAQYSNGHTRIILVGGDTILILIPAVAALALSCHRSTFARWWLGFCGVSGFVGLLISGTRSGLIVAVLMLVFVTIVSRPPLRIPNGWSIAVLLCSVVLLVAGLAANGTLHRFVTPDRPHVGVNFRADEVRSIFRLPRTDIVFGEGIGGRFLGKDVNGAQVVAGWAHAFPAWIVLKIGILGLVVVSLLALVAVWRRLVYVWRTRPLPLDTTLGCVLLLGVLIMSLTLGRAALAEGSILLGLAVALLGRADDALVP
jgi:hypothetical protein